VSGGNLCSQSRENLVLTGVMITLTIQVRRESLSKTQSHNTSGKAGSYLWAITYVPLRSEKSGLTQQLKFFPNIFGKQQDIALCDYRAREGLKAAFQKHGDHNVTSAKWKAANVVSPEVVLDCLHRHCVCLIIGLFCEGTRSKYSESLSSCKIVTITFIHFLFSPVQPNCENLLK